MPNKEIYKNLNHYAYNNFSQNGEDGIIEELNKRMRINDQKRSNWCVEFGAWDGKHLSNTFNLIKKSWQGVYIEGDLCRYRDLRSTQKDYPNIIAINSFVSKENFSKDSLDNILKSTNIPKDFEVLSIDVDSFDLEIWESMKEYSPKIVIIEINSSYPPGIVKWHSNNFKNSNGNSFSATLQVAKNKGYKLAIHTGNMIFVREDLIELIRIEKKFIKYPELLFNDLWYSIEKRSFIFKLCLKSKAFIKNKLLSKIIHFFKKLFLT